MNHTSHAHGEHCLACDMKTLRGFYARVQELFTDEESAAVARIALSAREASPWIAVSERLPVSGRRVLVLYQSFGGPRVVVSFYEPGAPAGDDDPLWTADSGIQYRVNFVTHWMPLPAPPEGES